MKLIDKYLFRTMALPLAYCVAGFTLIYVIYDLFENLSDFVEAETPLFQVLQFYACLMPSVIIIIMPISLLLATLYSLSQLSKNNEITAMRASGISLYRLIIPFIIVSSFTTISVAAIHETVGPWSAYWTEMFVKQERKKHEYSVHLVQNLAVKNNVDNRIWMIGEFDSQNFEMRNVEVVQQREDGSDLHKVQAKEAQWLDGRWWFSDISTQDYDPRGHPKGAAKFVLRREMTDLNETPKMFLNEIKDPEFLSSWELVGFLKSHEDLSSTTVARVKTDLHHRLAMPWTCFIVTLLGIPFGVQTARKGAFLGVALTIGLFFGYYVLITVGLAMGKKEVLEPWFAGWMPNLFFLSIGSALIYRMR